MKKATTLDPIPFVCWLSSGIAFGLLAGFVINYFIPVTYASRGILASGEKPGQEIPLSHYHARRISDQLAEEKRPFSAEKIRANTTLRTTPEGLEIIAIAPDKDIARDIAADAMRLVTSLEAEKQITAENPPASLPKPDPQLTGDWYKLRDLLANQARLSGFADFHQVPALAGQGSLKARKLAENEDFSRRFARYSEISTLLGRNRPSPESRSKVILQPETAQRPVSASYAEALSDCSTVAGGFLGLIGGFLFARRPRKSPAAAPEPLVLASSGANPAEW